MRVRAGVRRFRTRSDSHSVFSVLTVAHALTLFLACCKPECVLRVSLSWRVRVSENRVNCILSRSHSQTVLCVLVLALTLYLAFVLNVF